MKKFAKIFALVIVAVLMFGTIATVTACGPTEEKKKLVDVFWYQFSDTYLTTVRNSMKEQEKELKGFSFTHYDAGNDQEKQITQIETAITKGSSLLVVNIVTTGSEETAQKIVEKAKAAKIPLIFFNREVSNDIVKSYDQCVFVGTDAPEAGHMQGQMIYDYLSANDYANAKKIDKDGNHQIKYIMLRGELGNAEAAARTLFSVKDCNEKLAADTKNTSHYTLSPSSENKTDASQPEDGISRFYLYANWSRELAKGLVDTALTSSPAGGAQMELVIANNDDAALGAVDALRVKGFNLLKTATGYDATKIVPVFGVDATTAAMEAITGTSMAGTIKQDGVAMAAGLLTLAKNISDGKALDADLRTLFKNVDAGVNKVRIPYAIIKG